MHHNFFQQLQKERRVHVERRSGRDRRASRYDSYGAIERRRVADRRSGKDRRGREAIM
jgi:hypothetical protein